MLTVRFAPSCTNVQKVASGNRSSLQNHRWNMLAYYVLRVCSSIDGADVFR